MKKNELLTFWLASTLLLVAQAEEIPSFLKICHLSDTKLEQCIKNSIDVLKPELVKGIPKYTIPPLEPMQLGNATIFQDLPGRGFKISISGVQTFGITNYIIKKIKIVEHGRLYKAKIKFPKMYSIGQYVIDGQVFYLPINGTGDFRSNFSGGTAEVLFKLDPITVRNKTYAVLTKLDLEIAVKNGHLRLDNLFNNKEHELEDLVHQVVNDNFVIFSREFYPMVEKRISEVLSKIINKILGRFTEDQLFPL